MFLATCRGLKIFCEQRRNFHAVGQEVRVGFAVCVVTMVCERMGYREVNEVRNSTSPIEIEERLDEAHG